MRSRPVQGGPSSLCVCAVSVPCLCLSAFVLCCCFCCVFAVFVCCCRCCCCCCCQARIRRSLNGGADGLNMQCVPCGWNQYGAASSTLESDDCPSHCPPQNVCAPSPCAQSYPSYRTAFTSTSTLTLVCADPIIGATKITTQCAKETSSLRAHTCVLSVRQAPSRH